MHSKNNQVAILLLYSVFLRAKLPLSRLFPSLLFGTVNV